MINDASDVDRLVDQALAQISDDRVLTHIGRLRVEPKAILRDWNYGRPDERYICWTAVEDDRSNIGIAYCESGFGPMCPWGLVGVAGGRVEMSIGMDCHWFPNMLDAYFDCMASDLPIWRVFKRTGTRTISESANPITDEDSWEETWRRIKELRAKDPNSRYDCGHSIEIKRA